MIILILAYIYLFISLFIEKKLLSNREKITKIIDNCNFIIILFIYNIITATRINTGGSDYIAYKTFFNFKINENPWNYDYLFLYLRNIIKKLDLNYLYFIAIISIISHILIYIILRRYSKFPIISFFLYISLNYFWQNFTILRSSLSILFFWLSLNEIKKRKFFHFLIYWIIACGFHKGALPLLVLYFLLNIKLNVKKEKIILFLSILISIFLEKIIRIINIPMILQYVGDLEIATPIGYLILIIEKFGLYFYINLKKYNLKLKKEYNLFYNLAFLDLILSIAVYKIPSFTRYNHYFIIGFYIIISKILGEKWEKNKKYIYLNVTIILYFIMKFIKTVIFSSLYSNYNSWIFN